MLMDKTIYNRIQEAIEGANIKGIKFEQGYPCDHVLLVDNPFDNEELEEDELEEALENFKSIDPLVKAMQVIMETIKDYAEEEDGIEVRFCHLPGEETLFISIGDGR